MLTPWRENIERVRNAHHHAHMMLHFGLSGCPVCASLTALTTQMEELEGALRDARGRLMPLDEFMAIQGAFSDHVPIERVQMSRLLDAVAGLRAALFPEDSA